MWLSFKKCAKTNLGLNGLKDNKIKKNLIPYGGAWDAAATQPQDAASSHGHFMTRIYNKSR